jgi:hypothetical protein
MTMKGARDDNAKSPGWQMPVTPAPEPGSMPWLFRSTLWGQSTAHLHALNGRGSCR